MIRLKKETTIEQLHIALFGHTDYVREPGQVYAFKALRKGINPKRGPRPWVTIPYPTSKEIECSMSLFTRDLEELFEEV